MSLLTRAERLNLIDLLLELPNMNNAVVRRSLLDDLPRPLQDAVEFDNAAATHIANIVRTVSNPPWEQLPGGDWTVLTLIENAIYQARGSQTAQGLQTLLDGLKARATAIPAASPAAAPAALPPSTPANTAAGSGASGTGEPPNVQTGTGTQYNAGQIQGGHDAFVGSTVTQNYYYTNPSPPSGGQPTPTPQATGGGSPTPVSAPRAAVKLDRVGRKKLYDGLLATYPNMNALALMVNMSLDQNLAVIAGGDSLSTAVFNLMQWAESRGRLGDLIAAAAQDNPSNPDLNALTGGSGGAAGTA